MSHSRDNKRNWELALIMHLHYSTLAAMPQMRHQPSLLPSERYDAHPCVKGGHLIHELRKRAASMQSPLCPVPVAASEPLQMQWCVAGRLAHAVKLTWQWSTAAGWLP